MCLFVTHNSKTVKCMEMVNIPNDSCANGDPSHVFGAGCELQQASDDPKYISKLLHILVQTFPWFLMHRCGTYSQATKCVIVEVHLSLFINLVYLKTI